jgi:glycosyltransferase involved in cell wall biosynthesis
VRHARIARGTPATDRIAVFYGHDRIPGPDEPVHGGMVKFQALDEAFANSARDFTVLYLGSSTVPDDAGVLIHLARRRGAAFVWNQNGVAYPGWHGPGWERVNEPLRRGYLAADHVIFQSEFCKLSADRYLGPPPSSWEVLHNPVDTGRFTPGTGAADGLTLLLGGSQSQWYRFELAVEVLRGVLDSGADARLLVAGELSWLPDRRRAQAEATKLLASTRLIDRVELIGPYTQAEAPALYRRASLLLHPKYNDPCPTTVLEAMATGLPVVYSATGGTPEVVGPAAGIGVPAPLDWERDRPPTPQELARGVLEVSDRLVEYSKAARSRALEFRLEAWIARHRRLFEELVR